MNHRVTPTSKAGRRAIRIARALTPTLTKEQRDWNARVDAKKAAKKALKLPNSKDVK